jgi:hypothetical protein
LLSRRGSAATYKQALPISSALRFRFAVQQSTSDAISHPGWLLCGSGTPVPLARSARCRRDTAQNISCRKSKLSELLAAQISHCAVPSFESSRLGTWGRLEAPKTRRLAAKYALAIRRHSRPKPASLTRLVPRFVQLFQVAAQIELSGNLSATGKKEKHKDDA